MKQQAMKPLQADCLQRALVPSVPVKTKVCIATVVSRGFGIWLDEWLGSLLLNGQCEEALIVVFVVEGADDCFEVLSRYGQERPLLVVPIQPLVPVTPAIKGVIYSVARFIEAQYYICLEADALVLGSLQPLLETIRLCRDSILTVRGQGLCALVELDSWISIDARGTPADLTAMIGPEYAPRMRQGNGGLICGSRDMMLALDEQIQHMMPYAGKWIDTPSGCNWRDEWVFNLALHHLNCNVSIANSWNTQLHLNAFARGLTATGSGDNFRVFLPDGTEVNILHFVGHSKERFKSWRGHFARHAIAS